MPNLSRLCLHTITTKPWPIEEAISKYAEAGVQGISIWQQALEGRSFELVRKQISDAGLQVVSYVRGGFFPSVSKEKRMIAIDENKRMIDEANALGAPLLVLVCGADPDQPLSTSRGQIEDSIAELLSHAAHANVKLAIEPLHPMYADTRSAVTTLTEANNIAESLASPFVGVAIDVYHVWWDSRLFTEIKRCAQNENLLAFHVCDWRSPTRDMLNDRTIMGQGCINIPEIRKAVDEAGFNGFIEVEIFSTEYWNMDQDVFLKDIVNAYQTST